MWLSSLLLLLDPNGIVILWLVKVLENMSRSCFHLNGTQWVPRDKHTRRPQIYILACIIAATFSLKETPQNIEKTNTEIDVSLIFEGKEMFLQRNAIEKGQYMQMVNLQCFTPVVQTRKVFRG